MKKVLLLSVAAALMVLAAACGDKDKEPTPPEPVKTDKTVVFTAGNIETVLSDGELVTLQATYNVIIQLTGSNDFKTPDELTGFADNVINRKNKYKLGSVLTVDYGVAHDAFNKTDSTRLHNNGIAVLKQMPNAEEIAIMKARIAELEAKENEKGETPPDYWSWRMQIKAGLARSLNTGNASLSQSYYTRYFPKDRPLQNLADSVAAHIWAIDEYMWIWDLPPAYPHANLMRKTRDEVLIPYMNEIGNELIELREAVKYAELTKVAGYIVDPKEIQQALTQNTVNN